MDSKIKADLRKSPAGLSVDLDNQWSYLKTHGDSGWETFPSYIGFFVPRLLGLLKELGLRITFFIVGQDAALDKNRESLGMITEQGHEVGNHSFHHQPWLHLYSREQLKRDILDADEHILRVTGIKPVGFRGPGFSIHENLFDILSENGYLYDASLLPTFYGPLLRKYYFWTCRFTAEERQQRRYLFGGFRDGMRPLKPFYWRTPSGGLFLEVPVTTLPVLRIPFHLSYLLYIFRFSETLMLSYLRFVIFFCKIAGVNPSFLLHPLDLIGGEEVPELRFFPGMDLSGEQKTLAFRKVIQMLKNEYELINMSAFSQALLTRKKMRTINVR